MLDLILLPMLAAFLLIVVIGEKLARSYAIAIAGCAISLGMATYLFVANFNSTTVDSFNWMSISGSNFLLSLTGTNLSLGFSVLVSFISLMVLVFSVFYMRGEPQVRYYSQMSIFIFSMLGLVLSGSTLLFYVFWELVGVSSYLLIGFWYKKETAAAAGKKALIMTRVGDMAFLAAIIVLFLSTGTFSISSTIQAIPYLPSSIVLLTGALILIAAMSKSAQFPFYTWLPDAMEGPTPVSALLHSATMVAAGAYLLVVTVPLMSAAGLGPVIISIAMITAFIAIMLALHEKQIKRILAYSTIESLAFMFIAVGTLNAGGAMFYLFSHAVFKSLLFLVSGVLTTLFGVYDIYLLRARKLTGSWLMWPAFIGLASLAGLPPFMSMFAHVALAANFNLYENLAFLGIDFFTALFSFRLFFVVFNKGRGARLESEMADAFPIILLSAIAVAGGALAFYFNSIIQTTLSFGPFSLLSVVASVAGAYIAYALFYQNRSTSILKYFVGAASRLAEHGYDSIIKAVGDAVVRLGVMVSELDDRLSRAFELGADYSLALSADSRPIQTGSANSYIIAIIIGMIAVMAVAAAFV